MKKGQDPAQDDETEDQTGRRFGCGGPECPAGKEEAPNPAGRKVFILLPACSKKKELAEAVSKKDSLPDMRTTGVTTFISDSGMIRYKIMNNCISCNCIFTM